MRPIRLLILLLAIALALGLALMRPLQGRANRGPGRHVPHVARLVQPRRQLLSVTRAHLALGLDVVSYARHFLGVRYSWGGTSPRTGFDCSGLVRFVYRRFGIRLPHSSWGDLARGHRIARRFLRPGDLVFFYDASHVGIYVGHGHFIDAPHSGARVRISTMGKYSGYYGARRLRVS